MKLTKFKTGEYLNFKTISDVQTRFILKVKVSGEETSSFKTGKLINSSVSRIVNGKEKASKLTKAIGSGYQTSSFGKSVSSINKLIDYNFNMLYWQEPVDNKTVYSDNFQQFLNIQKVEEHRFKIQLPDGNFNYYSFKNGVCYFAELHHSLYTIYLQLKGY